MTKIFTNWRYYVLIALSTIGILGTILPFGEPVTPMTECGWLVLAVVSLGIGVGCFYAMHRLATAWYQEGKLHEVEALLKEWDNA